MYLALKVQSEAGKDENRPFVAMVWVDETLLARVKTMAEFVDGMADDGVNRAVRVELQAGAEFYGQDLYDYLWQNSTDEIHWIAYDKTGYLVYVNDQFQYVHGGEIYLYVGAWRAGNTCAWLEMWFEDDDEERLADTHEIDYDKLMALIPNSNDVPA
jgi:hypothetical protein